MHKIDHISASSEAIEDALSARVEAVRLARNMTQSQLAKEAGISRSTITRLVQNGKGISLDSFIRILKALDLAENLDLLLPAPGVSPLKELENDGLPLRQRARARARRPG